MIPGELMAETDLCTEVMTKGMRSFRNEDWFYALLG